MSIELQLTTGDEEWTFNLAEAVVPSPGDALSIDNQDGDPRDFRVVSRSPTRSVFETQVTSGTLRAEPWARFVEGHPNPRCERTSGSGSTVGSAIRPRRARRHSPGPRTQSAP
jgi:hypothetical protein